MKLLINIESDNEAMDDGFETVANCLEQILEYISAGETIGIVKDSNGNAVGRWEYDE